MIRLRNAISERLLRIVANRSNDFHSIFIADAGLDPTTDFVGAPLVGIDFGTADISGFCFRSADLRSANLSLVVGFHDADFTDADLEGAQIPPKGRDGRPPHTHAVEAARDGEKIGESFLSRANILLEVTVQSFEQALELASAHLAVTERLDESTCYSSLLETQRRGTTGIGDGVSIPHAKTADLAGEAVLSLFMRLNVPVDANALDDEPVDLLWVVVGGEESYAALLRTLAAVARLLRDSEMSVALRHAGTAGQVLELLRSRDYLKRTA